MSFLHELEHPVNEQCRKFYTSHTAEIREYRTEQLRRYQNISLSTEGVSFKGNADAAERSVTFSQDSRRRCPGARKFSGIYRKIYTLRVIFINPLMEMQMVMNNHLATEKGPAEFAAHNFRMYIGRGLVKAEMLDRDNWRITVDEYADVFVFRYNVETGVLCLLETGTRTVGTPENKEKAAPAK